MDILTYQNCKTNIQELRKFDLDVQNKIIQDLVCNSLQNISYQGRHL